jgi:hypothetical protein
MLESPLKQRSGGLMELTRHAIMVRGRAIGKIEFDLSGQLAAAGNCR